MSEKTPFPEALEGAFWEYERALMSNDLPTLDRLFAPGPSTLRGDAAGILVGHDAISDFRKGRGGAPARDILHVEVREISDVAALVIAVTQPRTGGRGQQSQLWQRIDGEWKVTAAHVSLPGPAVDPRVWRVAGTPLVTGSGDGLLMGETVAVKDLFAVEGYAIGAGNPEWLAGASIETTTATAVQHLVDEGASVVGIAQTDEFAYSIAGQNSHYGTPPNPAVVGGLPGGSSSGPASAVALGQASIGLGTDTGGSIRVPASYQGLWGLRTTHGAVPMDGLLPLSPTFDTVGWLTRTSAALKGAAGATLRAHAPAGDYVVAPALLEWAEPDVRAAFLAAVGTDVDTVDLGDVSELLAIFRTVQAAEAWETHGHWVAEHPDAFGADVAGRFAAAALITPEQEATARVDLVQARARLDEVLGDRVLLLPSASSMAPNVLADAAAIEATRQGTMRLTCIAGITGRPGLSVPLLSVPQPGALLPAPVGLCLVGPQNSEIALIAMGELLAESV